MAQASARIPKLFISYQTRMEDNVKTMVQLLRRDTKYSKIWIFIEHPLTKLISDIREAMDECEVVIICLSSHYQSSEPCMRGAVYTSMNGSGGFDIENLEARLDRICGFAQKKFVLSREHNSLSYRPAQPNVWNPQYTTPQLTQPNVWNPQYTTPQFAPHQYGPQLNPIQYRSPNNTQYSRYQWNNNDFGNSFIPTRPIGLEEQFSQMDVHDHNFQWCLQQLVQVPLDQQGASCWKLLNAGCVRKLIWALDVPHHQANAALLLGSIMCCTSSNGAREVFNNGGTEKLVGLLYSSSPETSKQAAFAAMNMTFGCIEACDRLVDLGAVPQLVNLTHTHDDETKSYAFRALSNIMQIDKRSVGIAYSNNAITHALMQIKGNTVLTFSAVVVLGHLTGEFPLQCHHQGGTSAVINLIKGGGVPQDPTQDARIAASWGVVDLLRKVPNAKTAFQEHQIKPKLQALKSAMPNNHVSASAYRQNIDLAISEL